VPSEVVARYIDGRVVKGLSYDVDPNRPFCHIWTQDEGSVSVHLANLKALFFVRDLVGDPRREEGDTLEPADSRAKGNSPIEVEFADGERVVGLTVRYPPVRPFFFILPVDTKSNNVRILVNRAAVVRMGKQLDAAG
jgi:uncharacterized protein DUF6982